MKSALKNGLFIQKYPLGESKFLVESGFQLKVGSEVWMGACIHFLIVILFLFYCFVVCFFVFEFSRQGFSV